MPIPNDSLLRRLSSLNVAGDFVEVPAIFYENFFYTAEFLKSFAYHAETRELISDELIDKLISSRSDRAPLRLYTYATYAYLDIFWHTEKGQEISNIREFEDEVFDREKWARQLPAVSLSTQFTHLFSGGYASGFYSYLWSEAFATDLWELFVEHGIIAPETANRFREVILFRGATIKLPRDYNLLRTQKFDSDALLRTYGLNPNGNETQ